MRGLTERDKAIYAFIDAYGSITIDQCAKIFMKGNKRKYEIASRRLKRLAECGYLKIGNIKYTNANVYYIDKKLSFHDLTVIQYCAELVDIGATNLRLERPKKWHDNLISDGLIYFEINHKPYLHIIEVCFSNRNVKVNFYDELYESNIIQNQYGLNPSLIIITEYNTNIKTNNIPLYNFDYSFDNLIKAVI